MRHSRFVQASGPGGCDPSRHRHLNAGATSMLKTLIRYLSYPLVMGACASVIIGLHLNGVNLWPSSMLVAIAGAVAVGLLERIAPYEAAWLQGHSDLVPDLWHNLVNLSLIQMVSFVLFQWTEFAPWQLWPRFRRAIA